ncbi:MAG: hypothetical protein M3299_11955 [Thermoproteota archaeon]|nr:hypothetical protein [Thermoproteota archaeon]
MERSKKSSRSKVIVFAAIGIGAFAIIAIILFSGFSIGTLTDTGSNPFGQGEPPEIILINNGSRYEGQLLGYTFSQRFESFEELPDVNMRNITAVSTDNIVSVEQGSQIQFVVEGNPPSEAQFDSLSVTAYTEDGTPLAVLDMLTTNSTEDPPILSFSVNKLQPGMQYILLSTATWLDYQDSSAITGYVYYIHRISIEAQ